VCVSLEEWGARIFIPYIKNILLDAKGGCEKSKIRFEGASTDLSNKVFYNNNDGVQESASVAMDDDISTDLHQGQKMICYYTTSVVVFNSF
jgi:hypothetical protein